MKTKKAFTLIELLIVVAIIAILAAIAVPNFLEAQVRAKVSRAKSDMRSLATAIESYRVDNTAYPMLFAPTSSTAGGPGGLINGPSVFRDGIEGISSRFIWLTTPVAYITSVFRDPFIPANVGLALGPNGQPLPDYDTYDYVDNKSFTSAGYPGNGSPLLGTGRAGTVSSGAEWHVVSAGPDRINAFGGGPTSYGVSTNQLGVDYDPTNGTVSSGDVVRFGGGPVDAPGSNKPSINRVKNEYNF